MTTLYDLYRSIFHRKLFFKFNLVLFKMSLRGIGVLNYENSTLSGEEHFLNRVAAKVETAFDVGGNEGDYSKAIKARNPRANVFAFEPHPLTYERLEKVGRLHLFKTFNFGLGKSKQSMKLFDYIGSNGSEHATMYKHVIEEVHGASAISYDVEVRTIDDTVEELGLCEIDLLKIDTEGNEYDVLMGASKLLTRGGIKLIQIEFNEMNIFSRTYLRDFMQLLKEFSFFRMLRDGLIPIKAPSPYLYEIFAYQNIIAIQSDKVNYYWL